MTSIPATLEEDAMEPKVSSWRRFRCRVVHMHYWTAFSNPDGERYVACAVCRTERVGRISPMAPVGAGTMTGI